jgi:hypothetical protein
VKYPGITLTSDIPCGKHIGNICGKKLKKFGFIESVVGSCTDEKVKEIGYFALVRPHLEYGARIWDPGRFKGKLSA